MAPSHFLFTILSALSNNKYLCKSKLMHWRDVCVGESLPTVCIYRSIRKIYHMGYVCLALTGTKLCIQPEKCPNCIAAKPTPPPHYLPSGGGGSDLWLEFLHSLRLIHHTQLLAFAQYRSIASCHFKMHHTTAQMVVPSIDSKYVPCGGLFIWYILVMCLSS